jgi:small subunit ribosomal protein S6
VNSYEALFIVKPDLKEEEAKNAFKALSELVTKHGGTIKKEEIWGKRQLVYPVKKFKDGNYYKLDFDSPGETIAKVEAACKLNADVLRTMITRK